jgi:hypothetical protein
MRDPGCGCRLLVATLLLALLAGCKEVDHTDPNIAAAIGEINAEFRSGYQQVLAQAGTRHFAVDPALAQKYMHQVLEKLGFIIVNSEGAYYLSVTAPAPAPLDKAEWEEVCRAHEPKMRDIAVKHIGIKGHLVQLEPDGLNILGTVTLLPAARGVDITITMRLQETKPQPADSILPRREYPPPTAVRIGYEKIWKAFGDLAVPPAQVAAAR